MLYKQLKGDDMLGQFAFINPASVSLAIVKRGKGGRVIASCLQRVTLTQLFFMPYNPGCHWILVVIDMKSTTIYYLDSLRGSMDCFLMNIMLIGLTNYHSHNGNQSDEGVVQWERVQVPMQSVNVECGYYVLRFMKDIIANRSVLTENFHGPQVYYNKFSSSRRIKLFSSNLEVLCHLILRINLEVGRKEQVLWYLPELSDHCWSISLTFEEIILKWYEGT
ncbi:hypothetical protein Q3G72_007185 [Acer saccharum]|nr:hypothetical protein Q3G72_007185 [Acer saccharum]